MSEINYHSFYTTHILSKMRNYYNCQIPEDKYDRYLCPESKTWALQTIAEKLIGGHISASQLF